jgi:hypothetical protein
MFDPDQYLYLYLKAWFFVFFLSGMEKCGSGTGSATLLKINLISIWMACLDAKRQRVLCCVFISSRRDNFVLESSVQKSSQGPPPLDIYRRAVGGEENQGKWQGIKRYNTSSRLV